MPTQSIPYNHFRSVDFNIQRNLQRNVVGDLTTQVRKSAVNRWAATFQTAPLTEVQRRAFLGFLDVLRGGLNDFYAYDPSNLLPQAYLTAALPASWPVAYGYGYCSDFTANTFRIWNIPTLLIQPGDLIGITPGDLVRRTLHRVTSGGGTGTDMTLGVEPEISPYFFGGIHYSVFINPTCNMVLDPNSVSSAIDAGSMGSIRFSGIQRQF
jgi:hypothetical protein